MAPDSAFCWVLVASPVKLRSPAMLMPVRPKVLPRALIGVTDADEPLLKLVPAF